MVTVLDVEACCRLNERFPALHHVWYYLWQRAIAHELSYSRS
jgi:hypothetical protein